MALYNNKTNYDPGRFRYPVIFLQESTTEAADGSQIVSYNIVKVTRAIREAVTRRFNISGNITIEAGATLMNDYWYFTIRYSKTFTPVKDMLLQTNNGLYTIVSAPELDEPPHYYRMLCVKTDKNSVIVPSPPLPTPVYRTEFDAVAGVSVNWQTDIVPGTSKTYQQVYGNNPNPRSWVLTENGNYINYGSPNLTENSGVLQQITFNFGDVQTGYLTF